MPRQPVIMMPLDRRQNIFFMVLSPTPGTFVIALHFKGRDKPILEMDLKIDDLLEKVRGGPIRKQNSEFSEMVLMRAGNGLAKGQ